MDRKYIIIVVGVVVAALAIFSLVYISSEKPLTNKKVAIIVFDRYNPVELDAAKSISDDTTIIAADRIKTPYDVYIKDMKPSDVDKYDAIIIVGGSGVYDRVTGKINDPNMDDVIKIVKEANKKGKIIGAICAAPAILAKAGILEGKEATVYLGLEDILTSNGAKYIKSDVVVSGNIITAKNPNVADEFAEKVSEKLKG